jgi:large subunit ribosomal protein L10
MAKTKIQKGEIVRSLAEKIKNSKSIVFTKFNQLGVKDNESLRDLLKKENSETYVAKKTLLDLAFKDEKIDGLNPKDFDGKVAAIFGYADEVAPAKIVDKFRVDKEDKIEFLGGILDGRFIDAREVVALSKIPSRQELYAKLVGSINAPVSGLVNVLAGNLRSLVYVLKAIEEKKAN